MFVILAVSVQIRKAATLQKFSRVTPLAEAIESMLYFIALAFLKKW